MESLPVAVHSLTAHAVEDALILFSHPPSISPILPDPFPCFAKYFPRGASPISSIFFPTHRFFVTSLFFELSTNLLSYFFFPSSLLKTLLHIVRSPRFISPFFLIISQVDLGPSIPLLRLFSARFPRRSLYSPSGYEFEISSSPDHSPENYYLKLF